MHKTALKCTFNSLNYWMHLHYALCVHYFFSYWKTAKYLACHPSNTLFSQHANCIAFWCDSLPCVCHTDVTPLPPWMHQSQGSMRPRKCHFFMHSMQTNISCMKYVMHMHSGCIMQVISDACIIQPTPVNQSWMGPSSVGLHGQCISQRRQIREGKKIQMWIWIHFIPKRICIMRYSHLGM